MLTWIEVSDTMRRPGVGGAAEEACIGSWAQLADPERLLQAVVTKGVSRCSSPAHGVWS